MFILPGLPTQTELRFRVPRANLQTLRLETADGTPVHGPLTSTPLMGPAGIVAHRILAQGLTPGTAYRLAAGTPADLLISRPVRTLPADIGGGFRIAMASCYSFSEDRRIEDSKLPYPPDLFKDDLDPIHVRFLT